MYTRVRAAPPVDARKYKPLRLARELKWGRGVIGVGMVEGGCGVGVGVGGWGPHGVPFVDERKGLGDADPRHARKVVAARQNAHVQSLLL